MGSEERKIVKKTRNELCEKGLNIKNLKGSTLKEKTQSFSSRFISRYCNK